MKLAKKLFKKFRITNPFKVSYLEEVSSRAKKKQKTILKLKKENASLKKKNNILQAKIDSNQEELTKYINKLFEQQEKERILTSTINNIRDSLDKDTVLEKAVSEVVKLLKLRRATISIYDEKNDFFTVSVEHVSPMDKYPRIQDLIKQFKLKKDMLEALTVGRENILSKHNKYSFDESVIELFNAIEIDKYIIIPLIFQDNFIGTLFVVGEQITFSQKELELLEDLAAQVAIAVGHAQLYSEAQQHIKLKSEFIASISHEIRTPINAIIGFSDLLHSDLYEFPDKQKQYLKNISMSGTHLLNIINNILDLSKLESGNCQLCFEQFPSELLINEVVAVLEAMANKKNIAITTNLCKSNIIADPKIFRQVLYNLINNAIKFTLPNGKIKINSHQKEGFLYVEVEDNGIGISEKYKDRIFDQFTQADSSYTRKQEGTGLGLTLAKKFIHLHRGSIHLESTENVGSKFWFKLPLSQTAYSNIEAWLDSRSAKS